MAKLCELEPGARFVVNGLEDDGELELVRLSPLSALVRPSTGKTRSFETYDGKLITFNSPAGVYHVSRETLITETLRPAPEAQGVPDPQEKDVRCLNHGQEEERSSSGTRGPRG